MPPNGAARSRTRNVFTQTMPLRTARPTRSAAPATLCRPSPTARTPSSWPARSLHASSANVCSVSTGPNTARCTTSLSSGLWLDQRRLDVQGVADAEPPRTIRSPCSSCPLDEPEHLLDVIGMDHRGDRRRRGAAVTEHVAVDGRVEASEEPVTHGSSTSSRVPARHTWPESSYCPAAFAAAASRSASAKTISGPFPPSSAVNGRRSPPPRGR